jgi:transcriptional regulator with XRE-family HTH domain
MSQTTLGQELGVSHRQVGYYERAVSSMDAGKLYQAAAVLGVTVLYFYEGFTPSTTKDTASS